MKKTNIALKPAALFIGAVLSLVALGGCTTQLSAPDINGLYQAAIAQNDVQRNPIIVIPGVLGSRLVDADGQVIWGAFGGGAADPQTAVGARAIALPLFRKQQISAGQFAWQQPTDGLQPDGVLDRIRVTLLALPIELKAYFNLLGTLGAGGYRDKDLGEAGAIDYGDDHFTCFQFAYDWRRSNEENAARLHDFIEEKRRYIKAEWKKRYNIEDKPVKFDIVAHSMGGLIARYYLRYGNQPLPADGSLPVLDWRGSRSIDNAVLIATPNMGAIDSVLELVRGTDVSWLLPRYDSALLSTFPSLFQLLPRARHGRLRFGEEQLDPFDIATWERFGWGLLNDDQAHWLPVLQPEANSIEQQRHHARAHLKTVLQRAEQFQAALDIPSSPPNGTRLHSFVGDTEATAAIVQVSENGSLSIAATKPGDGIVLRASAVGDERAGQEQAQQPRLLSPIAWHRLTFLGSDHLGLTSDPLFTNNLLYGLLEAPRSAP